jgi:hypothetical protein
MNEKYYRTQYLIGAAAGSTCLGLSLLVYQTEGALVAHGWIRERTMSAFFLLFMAVLWLFVGSIHHAKMLFARLSPDGREQPTEQPVRAGRVVTLTVLGTLALASIYEFCSVIMDALIPDLLR